MPKWEPRSRMGIYIGHSPSHAGSFTLVLNPRTRHVSPQYHVIYDENFTTVSCMSKGQVPSNWAQLVKDSSELVTTERYTLTETWNTSTTSPSPNPGDFSTEIEGDGSLDPSLDNTSSPPGDQRVTFTEDHHDSTSPSSELNAPRMKNLATSGLHRSSRLDPTARRTPFFSLFCSIGLLWSFATSLSSSGTGFLQHSYTKNIMNQFERINGLYDDTFNDFQHHIKQAMKEDDWKQFVDAMLDEVKVHEDREHWTLID